MTIGVCVKNCEQFVSEAIDSILAQDYPHDQIRLVFVDDGSEDNTLSILRDRVQKMDIQAVVLHTSWKGLGNARNTVIANSVGEYILWVDGDMVLSSDFLRNLVEFLEKNPGAAIVKGRQALTPGRNLLATLELYSRAAGRMVNYQSKQGRLKAVGTGGALYRVSAVKQIGMFDQNLRGNNEDWDFELRLRKAGWTRHTANVLFYDYERFGLSWNVLWRRYWLRGYNSRYFYHKHPGLMKHYLMFPPSASLFGLLSAFKLFALTGRKEVFLLPFPAGFKMTAWYAGFLGNHEDLETGA